MKRFGARKAYLVCMVIMSLFISILSGCGGGGGGHWNEPVPSSVIVSPADPVDGAADVVTNTNLTATFSEAMNPATIASPATNFTLKESVSGKPVEGVVTYTGNTATFNPNIDLTPNTKYTATISTGARDLNGKALANNRVWSFTTGPNADTTLPVVTSTSPLTTSPGPTPNVSTGSAISATFNKVMDPATITAGTFTVTGPGLTPVPGAAIPVTYDAATRKATFHPLSTPLGNGVTYTATIKGTDVNAAKDSRGNALAGNPLTPATASDYVWSFTTASTVVPLNPAGPNLGEAGRFVILAYAKVTTTGTTAISNGDIGITPAARTLLEGFTPNGSTGNLFELTNGTSFAPDDVNPLPFPYPIHYSTPVVGAPWTTTGAMLTQASTDLGIANSYLLADPSPGGAPTQNCPIQLGGLTLTRGVYKTTANVQITTGDLHLDAQGDPNAVFIFSIDGTLTTGAPGGNIILDGGAQARNIFFRTGGTTVIGPGTFFYGNIFAWTQVNVLAGANITGRLFAITEQVTLISDIVTKAP